MDISGCYIPDSSLPKIPSVLSRFVKACSPLARYAEDLGLLFSILAGPDGIDPWIVPMLLRDPNGVALNELRTAYFTDNGIASATEETKSIVLAAVEAHR